MSKILFVIGALECGGAEKILIDTTDYLSSCGHDVHILALCGNGANENALNKKVHFRSCIKTRNKFLRKTILKIIMLLPAKWSHFLLIKEHYDYEVAFLEGLPTKIVSGGKAKEKKYAWIHTNLEINQGSYRIYASFSEMCVTYQSYDKVICVSEGAKIGFKHIFKQIENVEVLRNLLNIDYVRTKSLSHSYFEYPSGTTLKLVAVGRLSKEKGYERLIIACAKLISSGIKLHLAIVGDGIERNRLKEIIRLHNLNNNISLLGYYANPYPLMKTADMLVCSSLEEGYSTVVTEALLLGTPVLATKCAGMHEISELSKGIRIVENSLYGLIEGLKDLSAPLSYNELKTYAVRDAVNFTNDDIHSYFKQLFS